MKLLNLTYLTTVITFTTLFFLPTTAISSTSETQSSVYKFDFGGTNTTLWPGFSRFTAEDMYSSKRGYGWLPIKSKKPDLIERTVKLFRGHARPDDLIGDWEIWYGSNEHPLSLRVDIPDGKYQVCLWTGGVNGSHLYTRADYTILAQGKEKININRSRKWPKRQLFREFDSSYEWRPGDDMWNKYVRKQRGKFHSFNVTVKNGQLDLSFKMQDHGGKLAKHEAAMYLELNALVIYPEEKSHKLNELLRKIKIRRHKQFNDMCRLVSPPISPGELPDISQKFQSAGFVPFTSDIMRPLYYNSVPKKETIGKPVTLSTALGQRSFARFAIYPLKNLSKVKLKISSLTNDSGEKLPTTNIKWGWFRWIEKPVYYRRRGSLDYRPVPRLLMPAGPSAAAKGLPKAFGIAVTPPIDTSPGSYKGSITIESSNHQNIKIPIAVTVHPFQLQDYPDDNYRFFIYRPMQIYLQYGNKWMTKKQMWHRVDQDLALMKEYSIAPTAMFNWKLSIEDLKIFMKLWKKNGFKRHPLFGDYEMLRMIGRHANHPHKYKLDYKPYIKKMKQVINEQEKHDWPTFYFYCTAELHQGMPSYLAAKKGYAIIKKAVPKAILVSLPNRMAEMRVMAKSKADVVGPNAISMRPESIRLIKQNGKKLWFYGWGRNRFRTGLADWRAGSRGGVSEWYSYAVVGSFNPFDGKHADSYNDAPPFIGPNGPIPTLGMERTTAGRIDFLYLSTLEQKIHKVSNINTPEVKQAKSLIESIKKRVHKGYYYYYKRMKQAPVKNHNTMDIRMNMSKITGWSASDYKKLRKQITESIIDLQKASN